MKNLALIVALLLLPVAVVAQTYIGLSSTRPTGLIQIAKGGNSNTSSAITVTFGSQVLVGDLVVVGTAMSGSITAPTPTFTSIAFSTDSMTASFAGGWTGSGVTGIYTRLFYGTIVTAGQTVLTVTPTAGPANIQIIAGEYAYTTVSQLTSGGGNGTGPICSSLTTTNPVDVFVYPIASNQASPGTSPASGFVIEASQGAAGSGSGNSATGPANLDFLDHVYTATGTYNTNETIGTSANYGCSEGAFQRN